MDILREIDISAEQHRRITALRNQCFPSDQVPRSYGKQLPHMRAIECCEDTIIAFMSLDYRVIRVEDQVLKVLGIVDLCVVETHRNQGVGTSMLAELAAWADGKEVDFIILLSDHNQYYTDRGYSRVSALNSWLRIDGHRNFGVAFEEKDVLYVKSINSQQWPKGHIDWLGYIF